MTGRWRSMAVVSVVWVLSGCGAMVNGPDQRVRIATLPPGAAISVDGQHLKSPARVTLRRGRDYTVTAELPGFTQSEGQFHSSPDNSVTFGNCVAFLCIPLLWEQGTPSMTRLEPEELEIVLTPAGWSPR